VKFRSILGKRFARLGRLGAKRSIDPVFAFIAIYMAFYQYFILTKLFGAEQTYGARSDGEVVKELVELFRHGIGHGSRQKRRAI